MRWGRLRRCAGLTVLACPRERFSQSPMFRLAESWQKTNPDGCYFLKVPPPQKKNAPGALVCSQTFQISTIWRFRRWFHSVVKPRMHKNGSEMRFKRDLSASKRLKTKKIYLLVPNTIKICPNWSIFETSASAPSSFHPSSSFRVFVRPFPFVLLPLPVSVRLPSSTRPSPVGIRSSIRPSQSLHFTHARSVGRVPINSTNGQPW